MHDESAPWPLHGRAMSSLEVACVCVSFEVAPWGVWDDLASANMGGSWKTWNPKGLGCSELKLQYANTWN